MKTLVSILIPAYNAERWIGETLESAIAQTWRRKEVIVVDDGSTDRTLEIAKAYASGAVKVISQENRGASIARNAALSVCQGDYIQWLDADDLLAPDKISTQLLHVERDLGPGTLLSSSYGIFYVRPEKAKFHANALWQDLGPVDWLTTKFQHNVWIILPAWLVSRRLTERAGPWDERLTLDDDGEYCSRVVSLCDHVRFVREAKSYYRQWDIGSLSRTSSDAGMESRFLSMNLSIGYLLTLDDSERARIACVSYLQARSHPFFYERQDLFHRLGELAEGLGGTLSRPREKRRYLAVERMFGRAALKNAKAFTAAAKLAASYYLDLFSSKLDISTPLDNSAFPGQNGFPRRGTG